MELSDFSGVGCHFRAEATTELTTVRIASSSPLASAMAFLLAGESL